MTSSFRPGTEATPLLYPSHSYPNDQDHPFSPDRRHLKLKKVLKFLVILIPLIVILLYIHRPKNVYKKPYPPFAGIKNPKEHHLTWRGAESFDYYLASSHSMIFANGIDEFGSNLGDKLIKSSGINGTAGIEFVAKRNSTSSVRKERVTEKGLNELKKRIAKGEENEFDEGVEIHYDIFIKFYESFKVLSATSSVNKEWMNSDIMLISYEDNDTEEEVDNREKTNNTEKYVENSKVTEICQFKINWSDDLEGVILKRNVNFVGDETNLNETGVNPYIVVAYVKGSIDYGFMFYEYKDGSGKLFAKINQTEVGWKMDQRNIYVYEDSPIPAILPALYIMYYDFFQRMSL